MTTVQINLNNGVLKTFEDGLLIEYPVRTCRRCNSKSVMLSKNTESGQRTEVEIRCIDCNHVVTGCSDFEALEKWTN